MPLDASDSGYEEDGLVEPLQKSYPELECAPNPHIMSHRLHKHVVKQTAPGDFHWPPSVY